MKNNNKDKNKELEELKKEIEKIIGKEEIARIKNTVELSLQSDEELEYKIIYRTPGNSTEYIIQKSLTITNPIFPAEKMWLEVNS